MSGQAVKGDAGRDIIQVIPVPGNSVDITWDTKHLWVVDDLTKKYHKLDMSDGSVINSYPFSEGFQYGKGVAFDGRDLWLLGWELPDGTGSKLQRMNFDSLGLTAAFDYPGEYTGNRPHGMAYAGSFLWANNMKTHTLDRINPNTGELISTLVAPTENSIGVAWDGKYLWTIDPGQSLIYRQDAATGQVLGSFAAPAADCNSLAWDDNYLWVVSAATDSAYRIDVGELNVIEKNPVPFDIYPNPGAGIFHLRVDDPGFRPEKVTVTDLQGKLLTESITGKENEANGIFILDLTGFPPGIYLVGLVSGNKMSSKKIILHKRVQ